MAFTGTFDYTLDAKNRLTVPAKMRSSLGETIVLARGQDKCLAIWPKPAFEAFVAEHLEGLGPRDPRRARIKRFYFANSFETELDSAGRIGIPPDHRAYAGLTKDVKVTGVDDSIEIWDRDEWDAFNAGLSYDSFADDPGAELP